MYSLAGISIHGINRATPPSPSMSNHFWSIAFGDYDFSIDRRTRTYRLVETQTGTVWADGLSLGWVSVENRETGEVTRHDFGELKTFSVSEKSGAQGKRVLFGLDIHGIPVDVYVVAAQREIQLIVEANRDNAQYRIVGFGLVPGLCSVPTDSKSHLVLPIRGGALRFPGSTPVETKRFAVWGYFENGIFAPFCGAVRKGGHTSSALALLTDSAYGHLNLSDDSSSGERLDWEYERDPERRRLDLRIQLLPNGDAISVARSYREKLIAERNHVPLRRKLRERPSLKNLIGATQLTYRQSHWLRDTIPETVWKIIDTLKVGNPDQAVVTFLPSGVWTEPYDSETLDNLDSARAADSFFGIEEYFDYPFGSDSVPSFVFTYDDPIDFTKVKDSRHIDIAYSGGLMADLVLREDQNSRWDSMAERLSRIEAAHKAEFLIGGSCTNDWAAIAIDFWKTIGLRGNQDFIPIPLLEVLYHDSVVTSIYNGSYLDSLIRLSPELLFYDHGMGAWESWIEGLPKITREQFVLRALHALTFPAFLTEHRFLSADFRVEEAVYSDKTRVLINQSETEIYEGTDITLPPLGFYVLHSQMEAHDALRIGDRLFEERRWRVRRSRDGKPLEESLDVEEREFPV